MNITETDPVFYDNLSRQMYSRRPLVVMLIDSIRAAPSVDELERVAHCDKPNTYFTYNRTCKLYFEVLGGDRVKLLDFTFKVYEKVDP